jgi:hypothetical protein
MIPKNNQKIELLSLLDNAEIAIDESIIPSADELIQRYKSETVARENLKPHTINLYYDDCHKVERQITIFHNKEEKKDIPKKDFYPYHFDGTKWIKGLGDRTLWKLYHQDLLILGKGKWILWHEGEKACDYALSRGLISTSLCGSLANKKTLEDDYVIAKMNHLIDLGIEGIIFISDHGKTGFEKANRLTKIAIHCGMPSVHLPIEVIFPPAKEGDDFVEYSESKINFPNELLKTVIESAIATEKEKLISLSAEESKGVNEDLIKSFEESYQHSPPDISENNLPLLFEKCVQKLSDNSLSEADRYTEIGKFCSQNKISPSILQKAISERIRNENKQVELEELKGDLDDLINVPNEQLNLNYIFGDLIAESLKQSALEIPTNPDAIVTILLPVLASVIGTRSRIIVNPNTRYIVPFIIRSMIVGSSGHRKSPTARLAIDALQTRNTEAHKRYKRELQSYQESEGNEPKPVLKRHIVQDSSLDGLIKVHADNLNGFLCFVDELFGYFKRMNKFNNGDDVQRDLELYEGKPLIKVRANEDSNIFLERTAISITGTIQEVALRQILHNKDDLTGISARWIIWAGKMPLALLSNRSQQSDQSFADLIGRAIDNLFDIEIDSDLLIDNQAYDLFQKWQHGIMNGMKDLSLPQLEAKYSKIESDVIKFAGILHYFYQITQPDIITNDVVINLETMKRAIVLGNYFLRHFCYIVTKCQDDLLNSQLLKILELVQRKGEISAVKVKQFIREFKDTDSLIINELFMDLIELGKVQQIPTKKGFKIKML